MNVCAARSNDDWLRDDIVCVSSNTAAACYYGCLA
jgi:hypothetical protein